MHLNFEGLLIAVVILVVLFGGSKIPELMRGLGKGAVEYKKGLDESKQKTPDDQV